MLIEILNQSENDIFESSVHSENEKTALFSNELLPLYFEMLKI